uniref:Uncharacterized protein n=1 Tax=Arundo donax TaxID=35708 RepID=A0A0A8Z831_ARUDO
MNHEPSALLIHSISKAECFNNYILFQLLNTLAGQPT